MTDQSDDRLAYNSSVEKLITDIMSPTNVCAGKRSLYELQIFLCKNPEPQEIHDTLESLLHQMKGTGEEKRWQACVVYAKMKRESNRKLENLLAYFTFRISRYPALYRGDVEPGISIREVTPDMIRGWYFDWETVCDTFRHTPKHHRQTRRRLEDDFKRIAIYLGFLE